MISNITDITNNINVNVFKANDKKRTIIVEYRLETQMFRYIGLSNKQKTGLPLGPSDIFEPDYIKSRLALEFISSFTSTSHYNIYKELKEKYPEEFI